MRYHRGHELGLIAYASGNLGKNLVWTAAETSLLFLLTAIFNIPMLYAGLILSVALIGDAVLSVAVGALIAAKEQRSFALNLISMAAPICGVAFAVLYIAPTTSFAWLVIVGVVIFRLAYACLDVPHNLLMLRIARGRIERLRVSSYRFICATIGALVVAVILLPALSQGGQSSAEMLAWFGVGGGIVVATTVGAAVRVADANSVHMSASGQSNGWIGSAFHPPLPALYAIAFVSGFTVPMFARVLLFETTAIWSPRISPSLILGAITLGQLAGAVALASFAANWNRMAALASAHALVAGACAILCALLLSGAQVPLPAALTLCGMLGCGIAGVFAVPWTLLCSSIEQMERRYKNRSDAQAFGWMLAALKIGAAVGTAVVAWSLWTIGFSPGQPVLPSDARALALGGFAIPLAGSILCGLLCVWLHLRFPDCDG